MVIGVRYKIREGSGEHVSDGAGSGRSNRVSKWQTFFHTPPFFRSEPPPEPTAKNKEPEPPKSGGSAVGYNTIGYITTGCTTIVCTTTGWLHRYSLWCNL